MKTNALNKFFYLLLGNVGMFSLMVTPLSALSSFQMDYNYLITPAGPTPVASVMQVNITDLSGSQSIMTMTPQGSAVYAYDIIGFNNSSVAALPQDPSSQFTTSAIQNIGLNTPHGLYNYGWGISAGGADTWYNPLVGAVDAASGASWFFNTIISPSYPYFSVVAAYVFDQNFNLHLNYYGALSVQQTVLTSAPEVPTYLLLGSFLGIGLWLKGRPRFQTFRKGVVA